MDIGWFRDLTIIICGILTFFILVAILVMMVMNFRRFSGIMNSLNSTVKNIEEISISARKEIISPLSQIGAIINSISRGVQSVSGLFRRK
jgi:hypothetical protein